MKREPIVSVRDLVKRYGAITAVDGATFDVETGEIFGLLGPNGAGKTTTISVLSCLTPPTSGRVTVAGLDVTQHSLDVRRRIGVVPQEIALYPTLSALDNLRFWGSMYGLRGEPLSRRIDELLDVTALAERARDRIDTFSGGMKRRINIAAGLLHRPDLLILDEPTVGIDPQTRRNILELVKELSAQGLTVLYTTHYLEEAEFLCDRIGIMDEGRMLAIGTREELTAGIGAAHIVRITAGGVDDAVVRWIESRPEVLELSHSERELAINVEAGSNPLPALVERLAASGVDIQSIDIDVPDLESVFLHLTGRTLRDEPARAGSEDRP